MAATIISRRLCLGLVLAMVSVVTQPASGLGEVVGGKTRVQDVDHNTQVQELGRYCVEEFNRKEQQENQNGSRVFRPLVFNRVVEAHQQIVSGTKYSLKIEVTSSDRTTKMFNSVVVVKPWALSNELLHFSPVTDPII